VYFVYSLLLSLGLVLSAPWWVLEMLRHGKYRAGLSERLGAVPQRLRDSEGRETIWVHAVSVGEVLAVSRLVEELKARQPGWRVVVSTTTDTGQKLARQRFGVQDVFYLPLDLSFAVKNYLHALQPKLLVLAESEFWPNLLHCAKQMGVGVAVVNTRVSNRSLPRYMRFRGLLRHVMRNIDIFLAQSQEDARRLIEIGAPAERVHVGGNLKFEVKPTGMAKIVEGFSAAVQNGNVGPVLVAGSTLEDEEAMLLECFRQVLTRFPSSLLVIAPRHPERFAAVAALLEPSGLPWQRRSQWDEQHLHPGCVFLLDTIGELASLYRFADVAFIGGSLVPKGGHNVLEAAQFGVPILVGPHTENFRDIIATFQAANAICVVSVDSLTPTVLNLLADDSLRHNLGLRAREVMEAQQGATARTLEALVELLLTNRSTHPAETHA
jgi:3-deoxy-D-manno-octulosonic-acid transferase